MRKLAWAFGKQKRPDYGQFEDLYRALGLGVDCLVDGLPPAFTPADKAPPPTAWPSLRSG